MGVRSRLGLGMSLKCIKIDKIESETTYCCVRRRILVVRVVGQRRAKKLSFYWAGKFDVFNSLEIF